ncbi:9848_t:CDS:2, partial [Dentiscutata heterogama]
MQFSKWTTGNEEIDKLIQECQSNTVSPSHVIEWIPYEHFEKIKLETSTDNSDVYIATWKNGSFAEWDNEQQKLKRGGRGTYILKSLKISEKQYNEIKTSFTTEKLFSQSHVRCYELTRNPQSNEFTLILHKMDSDLRQFLKGKRPIIDVGTPDDYVDLMIKCWDDDLEKRPDAETVMTKIEDMLRNIYANDDIIQELKLIPVNYRNSTSWRVLKSANSKKRPKIETMKMK